MKSILVISTLSFLLIFGGLYAFVQFQAAKSREAEPSLTGAELAAAQLVLEGIEEQKAQIAWQQQRLERMRSEVAVREQGLLEQRTRIEQAVEAMQASQDKFKAAREQSTQKLTKMFESMKPAAAAPIFTALDPDVALEVMSRMKERPAAKLLSRLDPGLAATLSTRLSLKGSR